MSVKYLQRLPLIFKNVLIKNSYWGLVAHFSQVIFTSLFFVVIARKYPTNAFASYIIATALYQLISSFSSLGLNQWFIREFATSFEKKGLINKFIKTQFFFGCIFYIVNILVATLIYDEKLVILLAVIIGTNIVFDNLINTIKSLNIAEFKQKRTFIIQTVEASLKLIAVSVLFLYPFSIIVLSIIVVVLRFITLNLFLKFGSTGTITLKGLWSYRVSFNEIKYLILINWPFVAIGGVSVLSWRVSNIIISKVLTESDVANYEISYKIFSIFQLLPIIISSTFFPTLVRLFKEMDMEKFLKVYKRTYLLYSIFGLISFTFIYSYAEFLIPLVFGSNYEGTVIYTKQMFLTILVFPTVFLQANVLTAMKLEKVDMWMNVASLITNFVVCFIGFFFIKSLLIINLSIFLSFFVFHALQDIVLIKKKISTVNFACSFYFILPLIILSYIYISELFRSHYFFISYWTILILFVLYLRKLRLVNV